MGDQTLANAVGRTEPNDSSSQHCHPNIGNKLSNVVVNKMDDHLVEQRFQIMAVEAGGKRTLQEDKRNVYSSALG